jgi:hypothetical protein
MILIKYFLTAYGMVIIKNSIVIKHFTERGLKMTDVLSYMNSLKLTWHRRLLLGGENKCYALTYVVINTEKLFSCGRLHAEIIHNNLNNSFWKDVVKCYSDFMNNFQIVWTNSVVCHFLIQS